MVGELLVQALIIAAKVSNLNKLAIIYRNLAYEEFFVKDK